MKIGIDARICGESWYYGQFVCELTSLLQQELSKEHITIYSKDNLSLSRCSFFQNFRAGKIFTKDQHTHMVFFDYHIPPWYSWDYSIVIEGLKDVFFPKKKWLQRKINSRKLKNAIKNAKKIITLDGNTALELNERLNVPEEKIEKISGFFPTYPVASKSPLQLDIKTKHNIRWDYLIYDSGNEVHNNFERILRVVNKLKEKNISLYIIILCDETSIDLDIRNKVIEYDIASQVLFLWSVPHEHESSYYKQSSGVIFSSIYESFPFQFTKALAYNCTIFANEISANEHAMGESIYYLDPLSIHNMCDIIETQLKKNHIPDYNDILTKRSVLQSAKQLINILLSKD